MKIKVEVTEGVKGKFWWVAQDVDNKNFSECRSTRGFESRAKAQKIGDKVMGAMLEPILGEANGRIDDLNAQMDVLRQDKHRLQDEVNAAKRQADTYKTEKAQLERRLVEAKKSMFNDAKAVCISMAVAFAFLVLAVVCFFSIGTPQP